MKTKEGIVVTHECDLGYFARECKELPGRVCEPGEYRVCSECPWNPEVAGTMEVRMEKILSDFRKSGRGKKWLAEQRNGFEEFFMTGEWKG